MKTPPKAEIESDGRDLFVVFNGVKIAKRGQPGSAQAGQWISLEPGYRVLDGPDLESIVIEYQGARLQ